MAQILSLESPYFCGFRLHAKSQLAWLCTSCISETLIFVPRQTDTQNLNAVVALASAGNQIKFDWAGMLGPDMKIVAGTAGMPADPKDQY